MNDIKTLIAIFAIMVSCTYGYETKGRAKEPGIYHCRRDSGMGSEYRLDTEDARTIIYTGTDSGIEFIDIDTGKFIRLYEKESDPYHCSKEKEMS